MLMGTKGRRRLDKARLPHTHTQTKRMKNKTLSPIAKELLSSPCVSCYRLCVPTPTLPSHPVLSFTTSQLYQ
ncbi:hypothetical protein CEXT_3841 [Caerostris extrusa]|uniref:Uncharacterized protein n=1 Tax=Caerostris extrusa TaxID=172846 RepID=A0AAV4RLJ2_CAEEX|nr:hypothetical protein CEXT_3841 [Caerostris extrusa]